MPRFRANSQFSPGQHRPGAESQSPYASGHATGSYGISMQKKSQIIPWRHRFICNIFKYVQDNPGDREKSPLQEANPSIS